MGAAGRPGAERDRPADRRAGQVAATACSSACAACAAAAADPAAGTPGGARLVAPASGELPDLQIETGFIIWASYRLRPLPVRREPAPPPQPVNYYVPVRRRLRGLAAAAEGHLDHDPAVVLAMALGLLVAIACAWAKTVGPGAAALGGQRLRRADPQHAVPGAAVLLLLRPAGARPALVGAHGGADGDGGEPRRLCDRDHPRRHRSDPEGPDRGRPRAEPEAHQIFRFVILKPALKAIYPALTSQFILLMLSSSVVR